MSPTNIICSSANRKAEQPTTRSARIYWRTLSMKCWTRTARQARPGVKSLLSMRIPSLILLLPFLWTTLPALSQQTTLRSQSNIVLVPVLVKSAKGEIIYGLQAGDFVVEDEGVAQSVRLDDTPDAQQISMVI